MIDARTQPDQTVFQNRSVSPMPRQRSTFLRFAGKRQLSEVMNATAGSGVMPEVVSRLKEAVGPEKFRELHSALGD